MSLELLRERHAFPGSFTFKVIGQPDNDFAGRTRDAIAAVVSPQVVTAPAVRASSQGRHQALTFVVDVASAEQVMGVYAALKHVEGISFVL